jgi:hypothetical protein
LRFWSWLRRFLLMVLLLADHARWWKPAAV